MNQPQSRLRSRRGRSVPIHWAAVILAVLLIGLLTFVVINRGENLNSDSDGSTSASSTKDSEDSAQEPLGHPDLAAIVERWSVNAPGTHSVVIADERGEVLADTNGDRPYFMASIYKVYVAYVGYLKVDAGEFSLGEPYWGEWSRGRCLDEMIRTSHSPCAEKMMAEIGRDELARLLEPFGVSNTSWAGFTTTAGDAAAILGRLQRGEDLRSNSRQSMLESMNKQIYRDALVAGFSPLEVYDKVGFREQIDYHDTGIVRLADGRHLIVSVLTEQTGSANIAQLASEISSAYQ
jgi:beta-lactamase class A